MCDINVLVKNGIKINKCIELFGSIDLYNETMKDFFSGIDSKVKDLTIALNNEDLGGYVIDIHALKSGARYLGFDKLSEVALALEKACIANAPDEVKKDHQVLLERIKDYASIAKEYFASSTKEESSSKFGSRTWNSKPQDDGTSIVDQIISQTQNEKVIPTEPIIEENHTINTPVIENPLSNQEVVTHRSESIAPQSASYQVRQVNPNNELDSFVQNDNVTVLEDQNVVTKTSLYNLPKSNERNLSGFEDSNSVRTVTPEVKDIPVKSADIDHMPAYEYRPKSVVPTNINRSKKSDVKPGEEVRPIIIPKLRKDKILIVDDSDLIVNFVSRVLVDDYELIPVKDGREALKLLDDQNFRDDLKLCLLDLNMPNVNGYEVLEHCKNKNYFKDVPFIVESGVEDTSSLDKLNQYPVEGILLKPFKESDLKRVVEKTYATYFNN